MLSVEKAEAAIQRYQIAAFEEPDKMDFYFTLALKALKIKYRILKQPLPNWELFCKKCEIERIEKELEPVFECFLPKGID